VGWARLSTWAMLLIGFAGYAAIRRAHYLQ
jgi:hypothetical protein